MSKTWKKGYEGSISQDRFLKLSTNPQTINLIKNQYLKQRVDQKKVSWHRSRFNIYKKGCAVI